MENLLSSYQIEDGVLSTQRIHCLKESILLPSMKQYEGGKTVKGCMISNILSLTFPIFKYLRSKKFKLINQVTLKGQLSSQVLPYSLWRNQEWLRMMTKRMKKRTSAKEQEEESSRSMFKISALTRWPFIKVLIRGPRLKVRFQHILRCYLRTWCYKVFISSNFW